VAGKADPACCVSDLGCARSCVSFRYFTSLSCNGSSLQNKHLTWPVAIDLLRT
jgi:hypothetical protein